MAHGYILGRSEPYLRGGAEMKERNRRTSVRLSDISRAVDNVPFALYSTPNIKLPMTPIEQVINTLEHISTTSLPAAQMRRILRETLLTLYTERNRERGKP